MKVLFLIQDEKSPSSRYRVLQYIPYLEKRGIEIAVIPVPPFKKRWSIFMSLKKYDVVFIQKKLFQPWELWFLRKRARRLIYDFDDALMYRDSRSLNQESPSRIRRFKWMVKSCDLVIAGNDYLKEKAMKYNERITVVPTPIDTGRYSKKLYGKKARVTLGWIGSHGTLFYLEKMKPVLDSLGKRFDHIELKIVCDHFFDCSNLPVIKKLWNYDEEIADLKSFDIGLMPLTDDPWSRGKCGFKLLQYLAVGVPVVCSPVGVNKQIVKDGKNGYLAKTESDWMEKLSLLIGSDEGLREDMGMNGRKVVDTEYSLEVNSPKLLEALKV